MRITEIKLRRLIRSYLINETGLGVGMDPTGSTMPKGMKRSEYKQLEDADPEDFKTVIQILDPTGITSIPDIPPAYLAFQKSPTLMNKILLVLAVAAAIPVAGKISKLGSRGLKSVKQGLVASKQGIPANFASKADEGIEAIDRVSKASKTSSNVGKVANISREKAVSFANASRKTLESLKLGKTTVLKDDLYVFIAANPGGKKIAGGIVKPSKGMGKHTVKKGDTITKAEAALETARKKISPNALSRSGNVYLSPYPTAGAWSHYGSNVFMVKVPKGSKVTFVDGGVASEVNGALRAGKKEDAIEWAEDYWKGSDATVKGEEIITSGKVEVIGDVKELFDKDYIEDMSGWGASFR